MGTMDLDGQLTQEQFHSSQVGCISNNFDVNEFELEEEEQEEEDRIGDVVSSDSDDSKGRGTRADGAAAGSVSGSTGARLGRVWLPWSRDPRLSAGDERVRR